MRGFICETKAKSGLVLSASIFLLGYFGGLELSYSRIEKEESHGSASKLLLGKDRWADG
jgi:hypothetical protein